VGCSSSESISHPPWCPDPSCPSQWKNGFDLIRQSILKKTFDVTSLIIVWRDEKQDPAAQPLRYFCVDGMHRIEFVQELITQKHEDWPLGIFDPETGEIRLQCAVLRETPTRKEVIKCALARNSIAYSIVCTTYADTFASIKCRQRGDTRSCYWKGPEKPRSEKGAARDFEVWRVTPVVRKDDSWRYLGPY
jgi:hypothetical protein